MSFWEKKVFDVVEAFLEAHENIPISFWENCDESADWGRADPGVPVKVKASMGTEMYQRTTPQFADQRQNREYPVGKLAHKLTRRTGTAYLICIYVAEWFYL